MSAEMRTIVIKSLDRYSTLRRIEGWQQERLRTSSVLVAGAGALGNEILKNLALLGIGSIVLVDFDKIEMPNLARSILFRESDEHQPKAEIAACAVQTINPDVNVSVIKGNVAWDVGLGIFRRMNLVIGGLDNRAARVAINKQCWLVGTPWVDGALSASAGVVRVFVPPEGACYECTLADTDYQEMYLRFSCQGIALQGVVEGKIPTTPTIASIIGAMQVQEGLKLLHGQPVLAGHEIIYDDTLHTLQVVQLKRREGCLGHSRLGQIDELKGFRADQNTAGDLVTRVQADLGKEAHIELDREVIVGMTCPNGHVRNWALIPRYRLQAQEAKCKVCGTELDFLSTHTIDSNSRYLHATLAQWGIPPAHIVRARLGRFSLYYELTGDVKYILSAFDKNKDEESDV
jgi:molybdopterin/thiamine biosynthesis adenylyltransferase